MAVDSQLQLIVHVEVKWTPIAKTIRILFPLLNALVLPKNWSNSSNGIEVSPNKLSGVREINWKWTSFSFDCLFIPNERTMIVEIVK